MITPRSLVPHPLLAWVRACRAVVPLWAVVVVAQIAVMAVLLWPSPPASDAWLPYTVRIEVVSDGPGTIAWWWDRHAGYVGARVARARVDGGRVQEVGMAFPAGEFVRGMMKFSPREVRFAPIAHLERDGQVVMEIPLHSAQSARRSCSVAIEEGMVVARRAEGSPMGEVEFTFQPALRVPVPQDGAPAGIRSVVARERMIAIAFLTAGIGLMVMLGQVSERRRCEQGIHASPWLQRATIVTSVLALLFARRPDVIALPQFWAEDGAVFFTEQQRLGWAALVEPYAGYLHLWPRVTAALAGGLPTLWAPALYLLSALLAVAVALLRVASPRSGLPIPAACAVAVVLVPNMAEIVVSVTNAQWFGVIVLALIAIGRPATSRTQAAADLVLLAIFGLTGPFGLLLLPLFAWRAVVERDRHSIALLCVAVATGAVQAGCYTTVLQEPSDSFGETWVQLVSAVGWRTGGELLGLTSLLDARATPGLGLVLLAVWIGVAGLTARALPRRAHAMLLLAALAVLVGGMMRFRGFPGELFIAATTQRYFALPVIVAAWLLIGGLRWLAGWRQALSAAVLAVFVAHGVSVFRLPPLVALDWPAHAERISAGEATVVPINPAPWAIVYARREHAMHTSQSGR